MNAIYRGRRYSVVSAGADAVTLDSINPPGSRVDVSMDDPNLIFEPTTEDLSLAGAFERREIEAFEYPDGHTYPPDREIPKPMSSKIH